MSEYLIYHNPRCTKSRESLKVLEESGASFDVKLYLEEGLSVEEIWKLKKDLGLEILDFMRIKDPEFKSFGLTKESSESELVHALKESPKLLERPIIISINSKAVVGRPVEKTKSFLGIS
ncbi:arsenate reductase (glutaredoxin) [bacterium]|jgi:arsenate reductase (glutaredoxin)|nr:arsenate reductase (glutaredoxin) [bacterium]